MLRAAAAAAVLERRRLGRRDRVELWYQGSAAVRRPLPKRGMWAALEGLRAATGGAFLPIPTLAIFEEGEGTGHTALPGCAAAIGTSSLAERDGSPMVGEPRADPNRERRG